MPELTTNPSLNTISRTTDLSSLVAQQSAVNLDTKQLSGKAAAAISDVGAKKTVSPKITSADINAALQSATVSGATGSLVTSAKKVDAAIASATGTASNITRLASGTTSLAKSVNGFLKTATSSITSTFNKIGTDLAGNINGVLDGIFKDTNTKTSSSVNTQIVDPIKKLLESPPSSGVFKITSSGTGPTQASLSGITKEFGSKAESMVSTKLSTLVDRFNIDSVSDVGKSIQTNNALKNIKALTSDVSSLTKDISGLARQVNSTKSTILGQTNGVLRGISNDIQSFIGKTETIGALTGLSAISNFVSNPRATLQTVSGITVDTRGSGVDAKAANSLLDIARQVGCNTPEQYYNSVNEIDSLFRTLIDFAASLKMDDFLDALLGCNQISTSSGQDTLTEFVYKFSQTDPIVTDKLIGAIENPTLLDSQTIYNNLLTNPNTSITDVGTLNSIATKLGDTVDKGYSIDTISNDSLRVYDISSVSQTDSSLASSVLGNPALSDYCVGTELKLDATGNFSF